METTIENFECQDCFSVAPLDSHGRCARCKSNAVLAEARLPHAGTQNPPRRSQGDRL